MQRMYTRSEMDSMESWRGILALLVCIAHIFQINAFPYMGDTGFVQGIIGTVANISVIIFFVLSGILISHSADNLVRGGVFDWGQFLINRVTRIYPTLLAVLLLTVFYIGINLAINGSTAIIKLGSESYIARDLYSSAPIDYLFSLLMIHPGISQINGVLWSLYIEWWLYVSFMLFFLAMKSKKGKYLLYIGSIIPLMVPLYFYGQRTMIYGTVWLLGSFFSLYLRHKPKVFSILQNIAGISFVAYLFVVGPKGLDIVQTHWKIFAFLQLIIAFLFIDIVRKVFLGNAIKSLGRFSYTLYVLHFPTVLLFFSLWHRFYYDNAFLVILTSIGYLFFQVVASFYIAKITENKGFFRKLFVRNVDY